MESKKTTRANLETTRTANWLMGVIVVLAMLFASFEWKSTITASDYLPRTFDGGDEYLPPITPPAPTLEPPPPPKVEIAEIINEVENEVETPNAEIAGTEELNDPAPPKPPMHPGFDNNDDIETPTDGFFVVVETMPKFPGGDVALMNFIAQSIKYPTVALERGIEGSVICSFIIDKDGSITDVEIVRGIDVSLDKEAARVIGLMPKWSPGMQRDKAVRVKYTMPIRFRLQK